MAEKIKSLKVPKLVTQPGTTKQTKKELNEMFDLYTSVDQSSREQQGLEERDREASLNTDIYSAGYFEGYIGCEPSHPEQHSYWLGYQIGCREYWAKKLGVEIPTEF